MPRDQLVNRYIDLNNSLAQRVTRDECKHLGDNDPIAVILSRVCHFLPFQLECIFCISFLRLSFLRPFPNCEAEVFFSSFLFLSPTSVIFFLTSCFREGGRGGGGILLLHTLSCASVFIMWACRLLIYLCRFFSFISLHKTSLSPKDKLHSLFFFYWTLALPSIKARIYDQQSNIGVKWISWRKLNWSQVPILLCWLWRLQIVKPDVYVPYRRLLTSFTNNPHCALPHCATTSLFPREAHRV